MGQDLTDMSGLLIVENPIVRYYLIFPYITITICDGKTFLASCIGSISQTFSEISYNKMSIYIQINFNIYFIFVFFPQQGERLLLLIMILTIIFN